MKINEHIAVSTPRVLLVPYSRHHVTTYHEWMQDPAIQEATASEPLTLEEEFDNQESWRVSPDKLTFILCQPVMPGETTVAGYVDTPDKMIGDVNFFLYPWDDDESSAADSSETPRYCVGEVDIMIAESSERGRGYGRASLSAFLHYIHRNIARILQEYGTSNKENTRGDMSLKLLMVKIKESNTASLGLFKSLGFQQQGSVDYFGEIKLILEDPATLMSRAPDGYTEVIYTNRAN